MQWCHRQPLTEARGSHIPPLTHPPPFPASPLPSPFCCDNPQSAVSSHVQSSVSGVPYYIFRVQLCVPSPVVECIVCMTDICPQSGHHSSSNIASWLSSLSSNIKLVKIHNFENIMHICNLFFLQAHIVLRWTDQVRVSLNLSWVLLVTPLPSFICADLGPQCWQRPIPAWHKLILDWQIHTPVHPLENVEEHCVKSTVEVHCVEVYPSAFWSKEKCRVEWWSGSGAEI